MRINRDVAGGLFLVLISAAFLVIASGYQFGTPLRMGPGFFPIIVALILSMFGLVLTVSGLRQEPSSGTAEPTDRWGELRSTFAVLTSVLVFALTLERFGLIVATFLLVGIATLAETRRRWLKSLVLAGCLALIAVVIFPVALRLAIPIARVPF